MSLPAAPTSPLSIGTPWPPGAAPLHWHHLSPVNEPTRRAQVRHVRREHLPSDHPPPGRDRLRRPPPGPPLATGRGPGGRPAAGPPRPPGGSGILVRAGRARADP